MKSFHKAFWVAFALAAPVTSFSQEPAAPPADAGTKAEATPESKPEPQKEREKSPAELADLAKRQAEARVEALRAQIEERVTRAREDSTDSDCPTCNPFELEAEINELAQKFEEIENLDAGVRRKLERELQATAKAAVVDVKFATYQAQIVKAEESASSRGAQRAIDDIARIVDRASPGRTEGDQKKYAQFCTEASRAVRRIGKDAFKAEDDEDRYDDEDDSFMGGARRAWGGVTTMLSALNPTQQLAGDFRLTGRADEDEDAELDVESDESGAAAYRQANRILKICEGKVTGKARKLLKDRMFANTAKMFNHLAAIGPNSALNYYFSSLSFPRSSLARECRSLGRDACWRIAAIANGAQRDAIAFQQGRQELYKATFDSSKIDITLGTTQPSAIKDPATGRDILFSGLVDFNQRLIKGTIPTENPFTNPISDARVSPPVLGSTQGLQVPLVGQPLPRS